ncbi:MAG: alkane 1-monooxygenase [Deltaproteobacteria bacterium]|nr:alkane 1-monooxygenase [Deltaproteobacteria bacterium]
MTTAATATLAPSRRELRPRWLPFGLACLVPLLGLAVALAPRGPLLLAMPALLFGLVPLLDLLCGRSREPLEPESAARLLRLARYDLWLWLWVPLHWAVVLVAISQTGARLSQGTHTHLELGLQAVSVGMVGALGINVAHELMHRRGGAERALAEVLMMATSYTHFCVEHVLGHHRNVATPMDPASSRLGESAWAFLPRTILGGLRSAWHLEGERVRRTGEARTLRDRRLRYPLALLTLWVGIGVAWGPLALAFFLAQGAVGVVLLELVNYVEHYGLSRRELRAGVYERTTPFHSWNASERVTNWLLFHLERHADHHAYASRPYFALRHVDDSPQLPTGYAGMLLLALVPPLWRRVMDPRVHAWQERQRQLEAVADQG